MDASFSELLRAYRRVARLSQEQLAGRAGVGVRTVRDLELGRVQRPQRASVRLLAGALGLSPEQHAEFVSAASDAPPGPDTAEGHAGQQQGDARVPAQLPADVLDFTGRAAVAQELVRSLMDAPTGATAVVVTAIAGRAGVGKTALAVHVAQQARPAFPDGQLYVNLRGAEAQALDASAVLARFLQALGVPPGVVPPEQEERAGTFRSLLADRRVLVVLDNAGSEAQVRPLLPAGSGCAVLVTSRRRLAGLEGARRVDLDVLDEDEALTLLARVAGADRVDGDPASAAAIVGYCGRLPLAVRIAGAKLAVHPDWSGAELAHRLADERRRLHELKAGDLEVRTSAALSYQTLRSDARRAYRLLGLLDTPDFAPWVTAALLDITLEPAQDLVDELVDAQLLDETTRDGTGTYRYRFHDLLRVHARDCAAQEELAADADAAMGRALSGWLSLTEAAEGRLPDTSNDIPARAARPWSAPPALARRLADHALPWFEAEQQALVHAVEQACALHLTPLAWELAARFMAYCEVRSQWGPWRRSHEVALQACRRSGDRSGEATMLLGLGRSSAYTLRAGVEDYERALALFRQAGDDVGQARANVDLSGEYSMLMRYEDALATADRALDIIRHQALPGTEADAVLARGKALFGLGRLTESIATTQEALDRFAAASARRAEAQARFQLARARHAAGDLETAARLLHELLDLTRELGDQYGEAWVLVEYAQVRAGQGSTEVAEQALTVALELSRAIPAPVGRGGGRLRPRPPAPRAGTRGGGRRLLRARRTALGRGRQRAGRGQGAAGPVVG